jgi:hypothetical protein
MAQTPEDIAVHREIADATIGFSKLVIDQERIEAFSFGKYNDRKLEQSEVDKLKGSMVENGVLWFDHKNFLPLLVPTADYIDPSSYTKDITLGPNLPELKLSAKGREEYRKFIWASGQHRVQALVDYRKDLQANIDSLQTQQEAAELTSSDLPSIILQISRLEEELQSTRYWGVAIYDESEEYIVFNTV